MGFMMSDTNYQKFSEPAGWLGFIGYPVVMFALLMTNHYGYTELGLSSYNKYHTSLSIGYMVLFNKIDGDFKKRVNNEINIQSDDKYAYKNLYPSHMVILYALYEFLKSTCITALFLSFLLIYSK